VAFLDPRRLGRIRLVSSPLSSPPINTLGFDPVLKRAKPVKALLLDQAFSAGVGNWVADEILYHARIHPERRGNTLDDAEMQTLWTWVKEVPCVAVALNAEDKRFPENWLFKHRWVSS
jgi:formamidopyrimidine-DNA glycosylase